MQVILIEDLESHALIAERLLLKTGFSTVIWHPTAYAGLVASKHLLASHEAAKTPLILLDWALPIAPSPSLKGNIVAAELLRAMDCQEITPAHIVVLTHQPQADCYAEALGLGCSLVMPKPLNLEKALQLWQLAQQPTQSLTTSQRECVSQILRFSQSTLELLAHIPTTPTFYWDVNNVKHFLQAITSRDIEPAMARWIEQHGGFQQIQATIRTWSLNDPELERVRQMLINQPLSHWEDYAQTLALSKSSFYNLRRKVFEIIAQHLNHLNDQKHS